MQIISKKKIKGLLLLLFIVLFSTGLLLVVNYFFGDKMVIVMFKPNEVFESMKPELETAFTDSQIKYNIFEIEKSNTGEKEIHIEVLKKDAYAAECIYSLVYRYYSEMQS